MKKSEIESLINEKKIDKLIEKLELEKENDDEYCLLMLCKCYCTIGEEKAAKKIAKRYKTLFPAGEFISEIEQILLNTDNGILQERTVSALDAFGTLTRERKERQIPESINSCFLKYKIIGMEEPKEKLGTLYSQLRLQKEREQADFNQKTISSTNFIISGERGSGKTTLSYIIAELLYDFGIRARSEVIKISPRKLMDAYERDHDIGLSTLLANTNEMTVVIENVQDIISNTQYKPVDAMLEKLCEFMKTANTSVIITGIDEAINKMIVIDNDIKDCVYEIINIDKYSNMELFNIIKKMAEEKGFLFHDSARKVILKKINFGVHSSEFMNAISLERILNDAIKKKSNRFCRNDDDSDEALAILMPEDFSEDYQDESLEELLAKLDAMIGLTNVKTQIRKKVSNVLTQMSADEIGAERDFSHGTLHMLFIGNPGTGKTTIASIIGKIYQQLNLLPNGGQVVYCTRGDLIAQYQGQSAPLVKAKFKEAEGGILFIDEAYSLWHGKNDNFGKEAVDEIITQMENNKENMMVILAGYKKEMEEFLRNSNLGWNSRIKDKIEFEDYTVEEMTSIFIGMVADKKMQLENGSEKVIYTLLEEKSKVPNFGNARGVRNIFEDVLSEQSERIVLLKFNNRELRKEDYDTIKIEDLEKVTSKKNFSEKKLDDFLNELTSLTGLASVKKVVQELVNKVQVKKYMEQLGVQNNSDFGTLHLVFKGNSGTGKTTVARLLGQIYVKLGVLKKNIFIEAGRKDLVAEYLGQTVPRVINLLDRADGGILFIDEAYSLISDERDAFGREAVTALVSELENRRESLIVILAGYAREMDEFLDTNQGLASRFSNEIIFEDYSSDELVEIFKWMVNKKELILDDKITDELICETIIKKKSKVKDFANARGVRNVLDSIQSNKDTRIATAIRNGDEPTLEEIKTILVADMLL